MAKGRRMAGFGIIGSLVRAFQALICVSFAVARPLPTPVSSNSVLVALLDSHYTELAELVEKAMLLQKLEEIVDSTNVTIFAPNNDALERTIDSEFKRFLHQPGNVLSLQKLLRFHIVPRRIMAENWSNSSHKTLLEDENRVKLAGTHKRRLVDIAEVLHADSVVRADGVIHGINKVLVPPSVQRDFNLWRKGGVSLAAVMPQGAPVAADNSSSPSEDQSAKQQNSKRKMKYNADSVPKRSIQHAMASGKILAPAPAPGTGKGHLNGERQVKDFINTLVSYGGYSEMADILVNLTSVASELAKLVTEGYRVTVLAPNDKALGKLTNEELSEPGAIEQIVYYHIIPEYQTEENMYNAVRRFGHISYETLRVPYKITAEEADGTVLFRQGKHSAHLYDHDIYTDGRISVQGIDKVLSPNSDDSAESPGKSSSKGRELSEDDGTAEGRLQRLVCSVFGRVGTERCQ